MLSHEEIDRIKEERETLENWRTVSYHVIAEMLEACSVCGSVREKERLVRCRWCEDVCLCKEGTCAHHHQAETHPSVAFWTW